MATARMRVKGYAIRGTYDGGNYIDLHFGEDEAAFDCINVFDYVADKPTIENTTKDILREMQEWCAAAGDSLEHDLKEHSFNTRGF